MTKTTVTYDPATHRIVPIEPTAAMVKAGYDIFDDAQQIRAAILAAPQPPAVDTEPVLYQILWRTMTSENWVDANRSLYDIAKESERRILFTHPAPKVDAEPVAWKMVTPEQGNVIFLESKSEADKFAGYGDRVVTPMFAHAEPAPAQTRYRYIAQDSGGDIHLFTDHPVEGGYMWHGDTGETMHIACVEENPDWRCAIADIGDLFFERSDDFNLIQKLSCLLAEIAVAVKGVPDPLKRHSHHDLPELVEKMKIELEILRLQPAPADDEFRNEVEYMVCMLEEREFAESFSGDPLVSRLESAIITLLGEINPAPADEFIMDVSDLLDLLDRKEVDFLFSGRERIKRIRTVIREAREKQ